MIVKKDFGNIQGKKVYLYNLKNDNISVNIINYGGIIQSLFVKDKNNEFTDVVLGYNSLEEYVKDNPYFGAIVGRCANRISDAKFTLNGVQYLLDKNDNGHNCLHGGFNSVDKRVFDAKINGDVLMLSTRIKDMEDGFPSNIDLTVSYMITDDGLLIRYDANSDGDTVINLTNHTYFNLNGENSGKNIENIILRIDSDAITPVDKWLNTYNEYMKTENTPFDFKNPKNIGKDIEENNIILNYCGGYDVNYVLNGKGLRETVVAKSEYSGIVLTVMTDQKGVQFYSGNFLDGIKGKTHNYDRRYGFCLETQDFPNAVNCPSYPSVILKKGQKYFRETIFKFSREK